MKTILCLIGAATLLLTGGCVVRTHDHGGYYGPTEFERGEYRSYPGHRTYYRSHPAYRYDRYSYWDQYGNRHYYRARAYPESRGQHYPYTWERRY